MIKTKSVRHSNLFMGTTLFMGFLLLWGCSKNVAPPDVEEPPAPMVEQIPEPTPEPDKGLGESVQEEGFGIAEDNSGITEGGFVDIEPDPVEEIAEVVPEPEPVVEEFTPEPEPELQPVEPMDMSNDVFAAEPFEAPAEEPVVEEPVEVVEAPPVAEEPVEPFMAPEPEPEPVQEARLLPFEEAKQLQDVHFEFDRDQLDEQSKQILQSNAEWLKQNPNARVEIQGHADERGSTNYNLTLGERRAIQTKKYLMSLGIDESRLYTISYGEEKPFCFESNENCWWENRRAHFTVAE